MAARRRTQRAALITRGLAEITRLCVRKGAARETMMGLAGVGALRARFGFGQRLKKTRFGGDGVKAAAEGVRELAGDAVAAAPARRTRSCAAGP